MREGSEEAELFWQLLLDEPDDDGGSTALPPTAAAAQQQGQQGKQQQQFGLSQFMQHVGSEVALHLAAAAGAAR